MTAPRSGPEDVVPPPARTLVPQRIQRQRTKGWRMPEGAIYVGRPSRWGNQFPTEGAWIEWACRAFGYRTTPWWTQGMSVALYRWWMTGEPVIRGDGPDLGIRVEMTEGTMGSAVWIMHARAGVRDLPKRPAIEPLRGHDLACWCPEQNIVGMPMPCHADVLLEMLR